MIVKRGGGEGLEDGSRPLPESEIAMSHMSGSRRCQGRLLFIVAACQNS